MATPRFEADRNCPPQRDEPSGFFSPREPIPEIDLITRIAHMYDGQSSQRRPAVLHNQSGEVIGGTGGNARLATSSEVLDFLRWGVHRPPDEEWLKRESSPRGTKQAIGRTHLYRNSTSEPVPQVDADWKAIKKAREERKRLARKARNLGNGPKKHGRQY